MKKEDIGFTRGLVYAVAQCVRFGHDGVAEYLWDESGFEIADLSVCDNYDAKKVRELLQGED